MDDQNSQDNIQESQIVDGEIVTEKENTGNLQDDNQATVLLSLESLIKSNITSTDKLRNEVKEQRQMLEDVFLNNATYQEHLKIAKEAAKVKSATRSQLMKQPSVMAIANKVKGISSDIKEHQAALSDYLQEYQRLTGASEIEGEDGELREIINSSKVIKRTARKSK